MESRARGLGMQKVERRAEHTESGARKGQTVGISTYAHRSVMPWASEVAAVHRLFTVLRGPPLAVQYEVRAAALLAAVCASVHVAFVLPVWRRRCTRESSTCNGNTTR